MNRNRKLFFVDTSVLLYDKEAIHSFKGNDIYLSMQVLDELDKFKEASGILGESARYVNRFLDGLRKLGTLLSDGVYCEEHDTFYRVVSLNRETIRMVDEEILFDAEVPDNRILLSAIQVKNEPDNQGRDIRLITKDINLRVKCDALGVVAEDYYKDHINVDKFDAESVVWVGQTTVEHNGIDIGNVYAFGETDTPEELRGELAPNQLVIVKSGNASAICRTSSDSYKLINIREDDVQKSGIKPYDKEQMYALELLMDKNIPLLTMTGAPGSGKTFMALLVGIDQVVNGVYDRIVFTRSMQTVGKEIGFLPGDIDDKMAPWLGPIADNFRHAFKDMAYFEAMRNKGQIDVAPLSFIRGRTFPNSFIIVDEAQNATIHELKTIITRVGEGSKLVLMGDIDQIDTPYIDRYSNGLSIVIDRFRNSPLSGHIHLNRGRRSELANEANKLL